VLAGISGLVLEQRWKHTEFIARQILLLFWAASRKFSLSVERYVCAATPFCRTRQELVLGYCSASAVPSQMVRNEHIALSQHLDNTGHIKDRRRDW